MGRDLSHPASDVADGLGAAPAPVFPVSELPVVKLK